MSETEGFVLVNQNDFFSDSPPNPAEVIAEIRSWLQHTDYAGESSDFKKHLNSHVPGTGEWFEQTTEYQQWLSSTAHGALWIKAVAGVGKSVLTARLISRLQESESSTPVLFFFFRRIIAANHGPHSLVRDWMAQLLGFSPYLQARLDGLREHRRDAKDITLNEMWGLLLDALKSLDRVYCVIDALDELDSDHTDDFLKRLVALGESRPNAIKVLMTSRPLPQAHKVLNTPSILHLRLENRQANNDIALFVEHRLRQAHNLDEAKRQVIKTSIENRVHPSFLFARLTLDELLHKRSDGSLEVASVQNALRSLPPSLEDLYSQMLYDHSQLVSVPQEKQLLILQLTTHASRPLRLLEIASVLAFLDVTDRGIKHCDTKNLTRMSCGPLLEILEDETVSVIHHSFTEFLTDSGRGYRSKVDFPVIDSVQTNELMALICVKYLNSGVLSSWEAEETFDYKPDFMVDSRSAQRKYLKLQHPFLEYAANNWHYHVRQLREVSGELLDSLNIFVDTKNESFLAWMNASIRPALASKSLSPLHIASWGGMTSYAKKLVLAGHGVNELSEVLETPLTIAARKGWADTAILLLEHGAFPDEPNKYGLKPLHYAALSNHHVMVRALLDAGVSPMTGKVGEDPGHRYGNAPSMVGDSPLKYASESGCVESISAMLPYLGEEDLNSSLDWAVDSGRLPLVKFLLEASDMKAPSEICSQYLLDAAQALNWEMVQLLISKGADPSYQNLSYESERMVTRVKSVGRLPEHASLLLSVCSAANKSEAFEKCLDLALNVGCDVNARGRCGQSALHYCVQRCVITGVKKLLQHGADIHAKDVQGNTPLHMFRLSACNESILSELIRHGASWDIRNNFGQTPLHVCLHSSRGSHDLSCMLPYVKNWNIPDSEGNTPLHLVGMSESLPGQLIGAGADVNRKNDNGEVPLHMLRGSGLVDAGAALLAAGADIEARDNEGRTWFLRSVLWFKIEALQGILGLGADLHAVDYEGNGALHLVCERGCSVESMRFLLNAGADPLQVNNRGDTIYHVLIRNCLDTYGSFQSVIECVLTTEAPLMARNYRGETWLHAACDAKLRFPAASFLCPAENPLRSLSQYVIDEAMKMVDNAGRLPIHAAASRSEELVAWLIHKGADITCRTRRGQNPLHIAAAAGQSNIIGLLLESYASATEREEATNQPDVSGRTPLHYASCSGRTESVKLLLANYANVHIAAQDGQTALHSCAAFVRERGGGRVHLYHRAVNLGIDSDHETLRVTEIIHLLCQYGADVTAADRWRRTPLQIAVDYEQEEMVVALSEMQSAAEKSPSSPARSCDLTGQTYLASRHQVAGQIVDGLFESQALTEYAFATFQKLLKLGAYDVLEELARRGCEFTMDGDGEKYDFLNVLAQWGYTELFEKLGKLRDGTNWINGSVSCPFDRHSDIQPPIITISLRALPSLDLLKLAIGTFKADVNVQLFSECSWEFGASVLHNLAKGDHWWQAEAIRYVLENGADVTMVDLAGRTALHVAVQGGYRRFEIVKALLEYGANPNVVDNEGSAPVNLATQDVEMVQLLIHNGADIGLGRPPILCDAIEKQNVDLVRAILDRGIDCNKPFRDKLPTYEELHPPVSLDREYLLQCRKRAQNCAYALRPLHVAARFEPKDAEERQTATTILELLLKHGADPFLPIDDTTVMHELFDRNGVLEPLLRLPRLNLERRDGHGRTLLLAACNVQGNALAPLSTIIPTTSIDGKPRAELVWKLCDLGADVSAVDSEGNTALHLLIDSALNKVLLEKSHIIDLLPWLIEKCPSLLHHRNNTGYKPIHLAIKNQHRDAIQPLISAGADPLEPDPTGNTLLHYTACNPFFFVWDDDQEPGIKAKALGHALALGLSINTRNTDGDTPLAKYILTGGSGGFSLVSEDEDQKETETSVAWWFLNNGADFHTVNNAGETLLHLVARSQLSKMWSGNDRSMDSFRALLNMGLDPFREDCCQRTPVVGFLLLLLLFVSKSRAGMC